MHTTIKINCPSQTIKGLTIELPLGVVVFMDLAVYCNSGAWLLSPESQLHTAPVCTSSDIVSHLSSSSEQLEEGATTDAHKTCEHSQR
jgi:hypothetical protein